MSQPAATQALAHIERKLGIQLFERQPNGMIPTEFGTHFEPRLARTLEFLRRAESQARKEAGRCNEPKPRESFHRFCSPVQLRSLVAIAGSGSFSQAARDLGVSQPSVHRAMRDLAAVSGLKLFEQTCGGVIPTAATDAFVQNVGLAASEFRQAVYEIDELIGKVTTRINVGTLPLSRASIVPSAIDELMADTSNRVTVNCVDARYHSLLKELRFGNLDFLLGALRYPKPANDIEQEELFIDGLAVVTGPDHPLVNVEKATIQDTLQYPWIAPPRETPSGTYLFDKLRIQDLPDSPVRVVSSSLLLMRGLLARGNYVSIASKRQIEVEEQHGQLIRLPISLPDSGRAIGLTTRTDWVPTPVQQRFLNIVRKKCRE